MTFQYTLNTSLKKIDVTANSKPYFPLITRFCYMSRVFLRLVSIIWASLDKKFIHLPITEDEY